MSWHCICLDSIAPTPWRNGAGTTRELVVFPVREHWHWRMSVARISQDGPFSVFEGVERWFAVLSGAGVRLTLGGNTHALRPDSPPLSFDGGVLAECELVNGPTEDFNLMVRQGHGQMKRIDGRAALAVASGSAVGLWSGEHTARVTFEGATLEIAPRSLAWRHLDMGGRVEVEATRGLWMEIGE